MTAGAKKPKAPKTSPIDEYIQEANGHAAAQELFRSTPGSLWSPGSRFGELARDLRASQVDDIVTIVVSEQASATATGDVSTSRVSSTKNSVTSLFGPKSATGALANLAQSSGDTELKGQGETSRTAAITATLSARVTHVMPNGNLVVEGSKDILVNSERQIVTVRGVIRPNDLNSANQIPSNLVAELELHINGKGVVADAIRRPFFLYRLLLGLLPF